MVAVFPSTRTHSCDLANQQSDPETQQSLSLSIFYAYCSGSTSSIRAVLSAGCQGNAAADGEATVVLRDRSPTGREHEAAVSSESVQETSSQARRSHR